MIWTKQQIIEKLEKAKEEVNQFSFSINFNLRLFQTENSEIFIFTQKSQLCPGSIY